MGTATTSRVERVDTIVVGAGQAGLAAGHYLAARDADFVILSDEARPGDNWRRRWDSLRLFTPARYSGLPGMPFPAPPEHFPDKDEVADYLERYAERFELPVRTGQRVVSLARGEDGRYVLRTSDGVTLEASNVIVATGAFQTPRIPAVARRLSPEIHQIHSSEYHNPLELPKGPVLVAGAGNSGAQIALELATMRKVWLAGRDVGTIRRRLLGADIFTWLWPLMRRATMDTRIGRKLRAEGRTGDKRMGITVREIDAAGIVRVGRVDEARGGLPVCDGEPIAPSSIVWCTGFAPDYRWIDLPIFGEDGYPRHARGVVPEAPGLFFLGLRFQHRVNSSLIGGVGMDAEHVAMLAANRGEALAVA